MSGVKTPISSRLHTAEVRRQLSSARRWILVLAAVIIALPIGASIQLSILLQLSRDSFENEQAISGFVATLFATGPLAFIALLALLYSRRAGQYLRIPGDEELFFVARGYKRFWLWAAFVLLTLLGIPLLGIAGSLGIALITGDRS